MERLLPSPPVAVGTLVGEVSTSMAVCLCCRVGWTSVLTSCFLLPARYHI